MEEGLKQCEPAGLAIPEAGEENGRSDPWLMNGLTLAYIGDAVFEILVRQHMLNTGSRQVDRLHRHTTAVVNAGKQAMMIQAIMDQLTEKERAVYKRGRNSSTVTAAKHQSVTDYRKATGLEAVFGYLYLNQEYDRVRLLFDSCMKTLEDQT